MRRNGPPCSLVRGTPSTSQATIGWIRWISFKERDVEWFLSLRATKLANLMSEFGRTSFIKRSKGTPVTFMSNLDQRVTQWMSSVWSILNPCWSSVRDHVRGAEQPPSILKVHGRSQSLGGSSPTKGHLSAFTSCCLGGNLDALGSFMPEP